VPVFAASHQFAGRGVAPGEAYLDLKQPAEAKRFYQAATEWLDQPRNPKDRLGTAFEPVEA